MLNLDYRVLIPATIAVSALVGFGVLYAIEIDQQQQVLNEHPRNTPERLVFVGDNISEFFDGTQELKKLSSTQEIQRFIDMLVLANAAIQREPHSQWSSADSARLQANTGSIRLDRSAQPVPFAEPDLAVSSSNEHSKTNVQVKGVDEPDYLKTDGKYAYIVSDRKLTILEVYPAEDAKIVLKTVLDIKSQNLQNIFLNGNRLVLFYSGATQEEIIPEYDFQPRSIRQPTTHVLIIDVSNKKDPDILRDYEVDGSFYNARMINDHAYLVTVSGIEYRLPSHHSIPTISERYSGTNITPKVYYFDNLERNYSFNTITAIDIFEGTISSESFLMGDTGTMYVSEDSMYLTYQQRSPQAYPGSFKHERFFDVVVPLLPNSIQEEISKIQNDTTIAWHDKWGIISEILQDAYNSMDKESKQRLFSAIKEKLHRYDSKIQQESKKTIIHKISIQGQDLEYKAKGSVPGFLLNQFSMDEHQEKLRIATTNEDNAPRRDSTRHNAVYVLDENLNTIGSLDKIAPNESIFSARFMGDRLYLVTFERIDPFFVIDLSGDTPKILGELKIPGFSNYLHPYDKEHIIGIGRDTTDKDGRVREHGIKLALFDVSDVSNPVVLDDVVIGDRGTDSAALSDHRSFLFSKERDILSIPISGNTDALTDTKPVTLHNKWHGFYAYGLDPSDGFTLKGTIQHTGNDSWPHSHNKPRSFYIEDVLYTVSDAYLKMNGLKDINEINSVKLDSHTGRFFDMLE